MADALLDTSILIDAPSRLAAENAAVSVVSQIAATALAHGLALVTRDREQAQLLGSRAVLVPAGD